MREQSPGGCLERVGDAEPGAIEGGQKIKLRRSMSPSAIRGLKLVFSAPVTNCYISGMDAKPKRRWFRYSFRTLLVFVIIANAGFGWLGVQVRQRQGQREVIETIE